MTWWTDYQGRRGQDRKTLYINNMKNLISTEFINSTSYKQVEINDVDRNVRIVEENSLIKNPNRKRLICYPDETISVGEIVIWNSENWICVNNDTTSEINDIGIIEKSNNTLSFYNSHILYTIPCIISAMGNSLGLNTDETKYISDLSTDIFVKVPNDSTSLLIEINQSFQIGKYNYEVENISDIIEPGLLILKMKFSEIGEISHSFAVNILNGSSISIQQGATLQLNVEITDNNVVLSPTPTVTYSSSNTAKATVSSTGLVTAVSTGSCVITSSYNGVSDSITINVVAEVTDNYTISISGLNSIKINKSETYEATIYNNGIIEDVDCTWSLTGSYASIASSDTDSCIITAGNISGHSVTLRATKSDDETIYKDFIINIVGLW